MDTHRRSKAIDRARKAHAKCEREFVNTVLLSFDTHARDDFHAVGELVRPERVQNLNVSFP